MTLYTLPLMKNRISWGSHKHLSFAKAALALNFMMRSSLSNKFASCTQASEVLSTPSWSSPKYIKTTIDYDTVLRWEFGAWTQPSQHQHDYDQWKPVESRVKRGEKFISELRRLITDLGTCMFHIRIYKRQPCTTVVKFSLIPHSTVN